MGEQAAAGEPFGMRTHPETGGIAQLGEHLPCKQGVTSSNLVISTRRSEDVKAESPQMRSIWERLQEMRGKLACQSDSLQERRRRSLQGDRKQSISEPHVTEQAKLAKSRDSEE